MKCKTCGEKLGEFVEPAVENDGGYVQGLACFDASCPEFDKGVGVEEVELVCPKELQERLNEAFGSLN
tara:strand:+ start:429 stop:632 length:204 start_codon:yes stop_codon:yes gene_type:complete